MSTTTDTYLPPVPIWEVLGDPDEYTDRLREEMQQYEETMRRENPEPEGPYVPDDIMHLVQEHPEHGREIVNAYETLMAEKEFMTRVISDMDFRKTQTLNQQQETSTSAHSPTRRRVEQYQSQAAVRVLQKWEEQERRWEQINEHLAARVGREVADTVFNRVYDNRRRKEFAELLDRAVPLTEKYIDSQWLMSLRNNWTRYTPLGNIFSGLFISAEESVIKDTPIEMVGRPAGALGPRLAASMARSQIRSRARRRGWEGSEFLKARKTQYASTMKKLLPHEPDIDNLFVQGTSLEETFYRRATHEVTAEDVEQFLFTADPSRFASLRMHTLRNDPSAILEEDEAAPLPEPSEPAALAPGPRATLSAPYLSLSCMTGGVAQGMLTLANTGTTALYYDWMQVPSKGPLEADGVAAPIKQVVSTGAFVISPMKGALLPGKTQVFRVTFTALEPGTVLEHWNLETRPKLPERLSKIIFRGLSVVEDANQLSRRALVAKMEEAEKERAVVRAVDRLLENFALTVDAPVPHAAVPGYDIDALVAFMGANNEANPDLFYNPVVFEEFGALYGSFRTRVHAVLADRKKRKEEEEAAAAAEATKGKGGSKDKKKAAAADENPPPPEPTVLDEFPEQWDGSLEGIQRASATFVAFVSELDEKDRDSTEGMAAVEASAKMQSRVAQLLGSMRFPPAHDGLVARAIRDELLALADEVEAKGEQILQAMGPLSFSLPEDAEGEDEGLSQEELEERRQEEEALAKKARMAKWRTKAIQACKKIVAQRLTDDLFRRIDALEESVRSAVYAEIDKIDQTTDQGQWEVVQWIQRVRKLLPPERLEPSEQGEGAPGSEASHATALPSAEPSRGG